MLPPTFSCEVRSILTPRSWNSRASVRCTIVAPTWDLMSSPMTGRPVFRKRLFPQRPRAVGLWERVGPVVLEGDEGGNAVPEGAAGLEDLLDVPLRRLLGPDREVGHDDVGLRLLEDLDDVGGLAGRLGDLLLEVLAQAVVGHPAMDLDAELRGHLGELDRVVLPRPDRL